jgi:hypothetical protein
MRLLPAALATGLLATASPAVAAPYFDVAKLPAPPVTGKEIADSVAEFSEGYENRVTGSPSEQLATQRIAADAEELGYDVEVLTLPVRAGVPGPSPLRAVVATKRGTTKPDEHIVFGGHYDVVPETVQGAYDNGSGTMMLRALAKSFANVPTNRTLVFAWYNGEEEGTLASRPHARSFADTGRKVRAMLGFDMVGIGWPVASTGATNCLCTWRGDEDDAFDALLEHVNFDVLGFPDEPNKVEHRGQNTRNSDEASWDVLGFPTMRWAGMRTASSYPAYHLPDDTMATIDEVAGGRIFFEQGLRNTLLSSYYTALALDNESPVARATVSGTGPHTFDATGSTDPDAPVGDVVWDFGDGTRATGAKVTHEYAQPGVYTATVSVGDSLWSRQVRSTATVRVDVAPKPAAAPPAVAPQPLATPKRPAKKKSATRKAKVRCRTIRVRSKRTGRRRIVRKCVKVRAKKQRTASKKQRPR